MMTIWPEGVRQFKVGDRVQAKSGSSILQLLPSALGVVASVETNMSIKRVNVDLDSGGVAIQTPAIEWEYESDRMAQITGLNC